METWGKHQAGECGFLIQFHRQTLHGYSHGQDILTLKLERCSTEEKKEVLIKLYASETISYIIKA